MSLFDFFRKKQSPEFDLPTIVKQMFIENKLVYDEHKNGIFTTVVKGINSSFKTIVSCTKGNEIYICVSFPFPIPDHIAKIIPLELNRLRSNKEKAEICITEDKSMILCVSKHEVNRIPSTDEIKDMILDTVKLLDNSFHSLLCTILGYPDYGQLEHAMIANARIEGNEAEIKMRDGYMELTRQDNLLTSPRYGGRMLGFATFIIAQRISIERAENILKMQYPFNRIIQEAYNTGNDEERDILRKLLFLMSYTATDSDDDKDSYIGRTEATALMLTDKYSLLK